LADLKGDSVVRALVFAIALVSLSGAPAAAAEQFDLVCTAKKENQRYRIDLERGEWCAGQCKRIMKIAEITAGMLTLNEDKPTLSDRVRAHNRINRVTGDWEWYYFDPNYPSTMDHRGMCERAPFSGFPAGKF